MLSISNELFSDIKILIPNVKEADPTGMVPTSSTSITLLFGDSLAVALMNKIKFSKERFKVFHPGGNIGQALLLVKDIMVSGTKIPKIKITSNIKEASNKITKYYLEHLIPSTRLIILVCLLKKIQIQPQTQMVQL